MERIAAGKFVHTLIYLQLQFGGFVKPKSATRVLLLQVLGGLGISQRIVGRFRKMLQGNLVSNC